MRNTVFFLLGLIALKAYPQNKPAVVSEVDIKRYTGVWYEIARLPNPFEKNLKCITATYTLREDGKITVVNKGHKITEPEKISSSKGVAWIPDKSVPAKLKVQFFWPFSGDYWIIELDRDYKYVLVGEPSYKYLWILAREKKIDDSIYKMLINRAASEGFDIKPIILVDHDCR